MLHDQAARPDVCGGLALAGRDLLGRGDVVAQAGRLVDVGTVPSSS
ncbi:hypothetical protein MTP10_21605 [Nonomuraea sp. 3-1Str]|nr:hypothetical protein [Nonomuraea sp. 3-1Str]MDR8411317.1 hypothetical protein [Nonomuraea sp. 3-1Str]